IPEHRPPGTAWCPVGWAGRLPVAGLLVRRRGRRHRGTLVAWAQRAGAERRCEPQREYQRPHQECPAGLDSGLGCGCATRTWTPPLIESGGLSTSVSAGVTPESTSTSVPKSRPSVIVFRCTRCAPSSVATSSPWVRNSTAFTGTRTVLVPAGRLKAT